MASFAAGRLADCFGQGFEFAASHTRSSAIPAGMMRMLDFGDVRGRRRGLFMRTSHSCRGTDTPGYLCLHDRHELGKDRG